LRRATPTHRSHATSYQAGRRTRGSSATDDASSSTLYCRAILEAVASRNFRTGNRVHHARHAAVITASDDLIVPPRLSGTGSQRGGYRKSKQAKLVGDWAEAVALRFVREQIGVDAVVHRAADGETPGWDIDFVDAKGEMHRVEVKGTTAAAFTGIELTAGEMEAARTHRGTYWLYLVSGCLSDSPKVQRVRDPAGQFEAKSWTAKPSLYSVRFA
jgi:uncharacterized protein DUF3883